MSTRAKLIRQAAALPKGSEERRQILAGLKQGGRPNYSYDPNVSFSARVYNLAGEFAEDVAKAVLRYASLGTPVTNLPGHVELRRGEATGVLVDRSGEEERSLAVVVRVHNNKIAVTLSDVEGDNEKKFRFSTDDTPSSIGADLSHEGGRYLLPQ